MKTARTLFRFKATTAFGLLGLSFVAFAQGTGSAKLESYSSELTPNEVEERYLNFLKSKGIKIFAVIDHAKAAKEAGLTMPNTRVVIFGNPKLGTKLMLENPQIALALPMKTLIARSGQQTTLSYKSFAEVLKEAKLAKPKISQKVSGLLKAAALHATKKE